MPTVTVPGVPLGDPVYSTISFQFQSTQAATLAVQLLGQIYTAAANQQLTVLDNGPPSLTIPGSNPTQTVKEFVLGDAGGIQNQGTTEGTVPAGFTAIVDAFTNQVSEIVGAAGQANETVISGGDMHFFTNGGSGTIIAGAGTVNGNNLVAANATGDGNWSVYFDGGNNTVYATSGNFLVNDGNSSTNGNNLIFLGSGNDTVVSWGQDSIIAGPGGTSLVATFRPGSIFWGNTGPSTYINMGGADTFVAGGGNDTVFAAASGGLYFGNTGSLTFVSGPGTADTVVTGSGNATLFGAAGSSGLYFLGSGKDVIVGAAETQTVVGGVTSGAAQIFGINGANITYFSTTNGNQLVAGPGNVTLNAGGSTGNNVFFASPGSTSSDSIVAGSGNNTLVAGPGSNTLVGGSGADVFSVTKAAAGGGSDSIFGWNGNDLVGLSGYGAPTSSGGLPAGATVSVVNGSEVLTLVDGTKITFVGFASIPNSHIFSS